MGREDAPLTRVPVTINEPDVAGDSEVRFADPVNGVSDGRPLVVWGVGCEVPAGVETCVPWLNSGSRKRTHSEDIPTTARKMRSLALELITLSSLRVEEKMPCRETALSLDGAKQSSEVCSAR